LDVQGGGWQMNHDHVRPFPDFASKSLFDASLDLTFKWLLSLSLGKKRVNIYQELSLIVMTRTVSEVFIDESVHGWGRQTYFTLKDDTYDKAPCEFTVIRDRILQKVADSA
jgi:hypothetical protein